MATLAPICAPTFAAAHPGVRLRILADSPSTLGRLVRLRTLDLAVAEASILESDEDLEVVARLASLPGYLVVRAGHPLTRKARASFTDALEYPFAQVVMLPPRVLKPMLASRQLAMPASAAPPMPFPAIECPTLSLATDIVAKSDAFTFASLGMVRVGLESGQIVAVLQEPWMHSSWAVVRLRKRTMSPAMTAFVEQLESANLEVAREEERLRGLWYRPKGARREPRRRAAGSPASSHPAEPISLVPATDGGRQ